VTIPRVAHSDRVRNPIDAFVSRSWRRRACRCRLRQTRLTVLRRAAFDLTGLPPEPSEAEAFLADKRPDAYDRLIDRLLASPRYRRVLGQTLARRRRLCRLRGEARAASSPALCLALPRLCHSLFQCGQTVWPLSAGTTGGRRIGGLRARDGNHPRRSRTTWSRPASSAWPPIPRGRNLTGFVPDRLEVMADAIDVLGSGVMGLDVQVRPVPQSQVRPDSAARLLPPIGRFQRGL